MADFDPAALANALRGLEEAGASVSSLRQSLSALNKRELAELTAALEATGESLEKSKNAIEAEKASIDSSVASLRAKISSTARLAETYEDEEKKLKKLIEVQKLQLELAIAQTRQDEDSIDNIREQERALESLQARLEGLRDTKKEVAASAKELSGTIKKAFSGDLKGVLSDVGNSLLKNNKTFQKLGKNFNAELNNLGTKGRLTMAGFTAGLLGAAAALKVLKEEFKLALEIENVRREFMRTTGASKDFSMSVIEAGEATRAFDRDMKKAFEASKELRKGFTDFTMLNARQRGEIQKTTTVLTALGIAGSDVAKGLQLSQKALGESAEESAKTQLQLNALARDIGVEPAQMASDFAAAGPHLSKLGRDGVKAFKDLAVASKITGIEVGRLLAITEKFDTFEGAAEQAGKLNAALGGNFVNAMELMTATDPAERFEMIRDSVLDAGLAFDDMSYYQRKFYADAMGLQDVSELALVLSGNMEALNGEIGKNSADYEHAAKMAADFQSVQDQLKNALYALLPVMTPLIEGIGAFAAGFADFVTKYKSEIRFVFGAILVILGFMAMAAAATFGPIMMAVTAMAGLISAVVGLRTALFVDRSSPTLFDGLLETAKRFEGLSGDTKQFGIETEVASSNVKEMRNSINQVSADRAGAPVQANYESFSKIVDTTVRETNNNYAQASNQVIHLNVDGKKMGEAVIGPAARGAAMGGV